MKPFEKGRIIGWGESQEPEDVAKTVDVIVKLTRRMVKDFQKKGVDKPWVERQLKMYNKAIKQIEAGKGSKDHNQQLVPRKHLMEKILELWD